MPAAKSYIYIYYVNGFKAITRRIKTFLESPEMMLKCQNNPQHCFTLWLYNLIYKTFRATLHCIGKSFNDL